ncbi:MAG: hypothetical protein RLZZ179_2056, partial [Verrucomicrobiota bacterium]
MLTRFLFVAAAACAPCTAGTAPLRVAICADDATFAESLATALAASPQAAVSACPVPDSAALAKADVLILQRRSFDPLPEPTQQALAAFSKRGGG